MNANLGEIPPWRDRKMLPVRFKWQVFQKLATSGMIETCEQVQKLAEMGFDTIVSLFLPDNEIHREIDRLGLRHIFLDLYDHDRIDPNLARGFMKYCQGSKKVLVHCRDGVGSCEAWAALLLMDRGLTLDAAIARISCPDSANQVRSVRRIADSLHLCIT